MANTLENQAVGTPKLPKSVYHVYVGSKKGRKTIITGGGAVFALTKDGCLKLTVVAETADEAGGKARCFATSIGPNSPDNAPTSAMYFFVEPQRFEDLVVISIEWIGNLDCL